MSLHWHQIPKFQVQAGPCVSRVLRAAPHAKLCCFLRQIPLVFFSVGMIVAVSGVAGGSLVAAHALLLYAVGLGWVWVKHGYSLPQRWRWSLIALLVVSPALLSRYPTHQPPQFRLPKSHTLL